MSCNCRGLEREILDEQYKIWMIIGIFGPTIVFSLLFSNIRTIPSLMSQIVHILSSQVFNKIS